MISRFMVAVAALALGAGVPALVRAATMPLGAPPPQHELVPPTPGLSVPRGDPAAALPDVLHRNVFSPERRRPGVRFSRADVSPGTQMEMPSLVLAGVLLGHPRGVVLQGLPGLTGDRVVMLHDTVAGYRLVGVTSAQAVLVRERDTLHLRLKEAS